MVAPEELDVFGSPTQTLGFCNRLRAELRRQNVLVRLDLSGVKRFSSDALLLMRAIMHKERGRASNTTGNLPDDAEVAAKLKASGFFSGFARPPADLPPPRGLFRHKQSRRVFSERAAELVRFGRQNAVLTSAVAIASNRTLVEAMQNTHNHANQSDRRRRSALVNWFAGV